LRRAKGDDGDEDDDGDDVTLRTDVCAKGRGNGLLRLVRRTASYMAEQCGRMLERALTDVVESLGPEDQRLLVQVSSTSCEQAHYSSRITQWLLLFFLSGCSAV
jgi:hypothetical protein